MKRLFLLLAAFALVLSLSACGNKELVCDDGEDEFIIEFDKDGVVGVTDPDEEDYSDEDLEELTEMIDDEYSGDDFEEKVEKYGEDIEDLAELFGEEVTCEVK